MSMPPQVQKILSDVDKSLHEKSPLTDILQLIEGKMGIRRLHFVLGIAALQALYLIFGHFAGLLCNIIGFIYPAYVSIMAIESATKDDDTQWLTYWVVFAVLSVIEFFVQQILAVFPIYFLFKAVFLLWLYLPSTRGATIVYGRAIRPLVLKHQSGVEKVVSGVKDAARDVYGEAKKRLE